MSTPTTPVSALTVEALEAAGKAGINPYAPTTPAAAPAAEPDDEPTREPHPEHDALAAEMGFTPAPAPEPSEKPEPTKQQIDDETLHARSVSDMDADLSAGRLSLARFAEEMTRRAKRDSLARVMPTYLDGYDVYSAGLRDDVFTYDEILPKVVEAWWRKTGFEEDVLHKIFEEEFLRERKSLYSEIGAEAEHAREVEKQKSFLKARAEAERRIRAEERIAETPPGETLTEMLAEGVPDIDWEIEGFLERESNAVLYAPGKTGKTTLLYNMIRSFLDQERFLDLLHVTPRQRKVLYIQPEMSRTKTLRQLNAAGIQNTDALLVWSTAGTNANFDLMDPERLKWMISEWKGKGITDVILDGLRPMLDATGISENDDAGRFLDRMNVFRAEIGAANLIIVHHAGKDGTARGSSKILDWGDANYKMSIDPDNESIRLLETGGRDIDFQTYHLTFVKEEKRYVANILSDGEGYVASREYLANATRNAAILGVVNTLHEAGKKPTHTGICTAQAGEKDAYSRDDVQDALDDLVAASKLITEQRGNRTYYRPAPAGWSLEDAEDDEMIADAATQFEGYAALGEAEQTALRDAVALTLAGEKISAPKTAAAIAGEDAEMRDSVIEFLFSIKQ